MPFKITGLMASKITSSWSVYNSRVANPPPVDNRHIESESHGEMEEILSKEMIHPLLAAIIRSRASLGSARSGAEFGSLKARRTSAVVDFALPCSPFKTSTGYGPVGRKVATSQPKRRFLSASLPMFTSPPILGGS